MTEQLKELRVSNDAMNDSVELRRRIADEGYLFFKRLQPPDKLLALRREMLTVIQQGGWLVPGTDPMEGIAEIVLALSDTRVPRRIQEKLALIRSLGARGAYGGVEPERFVWSRRLGGPNALQSGGAELLPLGGISRRLTVDCKEADAEPFMTYTTDEHGFNNPPGLWRAPLDLAAVGDSFTAVVCVAKDGTRWAVTHEIPQAGGKAAVAVGGC